MLTSGRMAVLRTRGQACRVLVLVSVLVLASRPANACSRVIESASKEVCASLTRNELIFVGTVTEMYPAAARSAQQEELARMLHRGELPLAPFGYVVNVRVEKALRGVRPGQILRFELSNSSCEFLPQLKTNYLIFANRIDGALVVDSFSTRPVEHVDHSLIDTIAQFSPKKRGGVLVGQVAYSPPSNGTGEPIMASLAHATIELISTNRRFTALTNNQGLFYIANIPPGQYTLRGPYGLLDESPALTISAGECSNIDIEAQAGSVSGFVVDSNGAPVVMDVILQARQPGRLKTLHSVETDEFGRFTVHGVAPGDYLVAAGWSSNQPSTYYPRTPNPTQAESVHVEARQHIEGITITVPVEP